MGLDSDFGLYIGIIIPICVIGIIYGIFNAWLIKKVNMGENEEQRLNEDNDKISTLKRIGVLISEGADEFLF